MYFDALNAKGGINGKYKVELEVLDSKYEAPTAKQQYAASKANVAAYVQILGTGMVDAILPDLATDGILAGPASLDAFATMVTTMASMLNSTILRASGEWFRATSPRRPRPARSSWSASASGETQSSPNSTSPLRGRGVFVALIEWATAMTAAYSSLYR